MEWKNTKKVIRFTTKRKLIKFPLNKRGEKTLDNTKKGE